MAYRYGCRYGEPETPLIKSTEDLIRVGLAVLLVVWCFHVLRPFLVPILWALVIAIVSYPVYRRLEAALRPRRTLAASLFTLLALVILTVPTVLLSDTLVASVEGLVAGLEQGTIQIPPPPPEVSQWPLIGSWLEPWWRRASQDFSSIPPTLAPHLKSVAAWLLAAATGAGLGLLQFIAAILIAGVLLARAEKDGELARTLAQRIAGDKGQKIFQTAEDTIRSVSRGILGVALIQSLLAGVGFLVMGVPAAGLWALLCLVLSVVQIGVFPVTAPVVLYVVATADWPTSVAFLIWSVFVSLIDNVLKPIFFGRGLDVPVFVIFVGAIGGLISFGVLGLFVGPVVLVVGYKLFMAWVHGFEEPGVAS